MGLRVNVTGTLADTVFVKSWLARALPVGTPLDVAAYRYSVAVTLPLLVTRTRSCRLEMTEPKLACRAGGKEHGAGHSQSLAACAGGRKVTTAARGARCRSVGSGLCTARLLGAGRALPGSLMGAGCALPGLAPTLKAKPFQRVEEVEYWPPRLVAMPDAVLPA